MESTQDQEVISNDDTVPQTNQEESDKEQITANNGKENTTRRNKKEKSYKCRYCAFSTLNEDEFYQHKEKEHFNGIQAYRCNMCCFVTRIKHHLDYHTMSRHSGGEKPYSCQFCDYKCINRSMLNSHMRSHQPPCETCKSSKCKCSSKTAGKRRPDMMKIPISKQPTMDLNQEALYAFQIQQNILNVLAQQCMTNFTPILNLNPHFVNPYARSFVSTFNEPVFETVRESECVENEKASSVEDHEITNNSRINLESQVDSSVSKNTRINLENVNKGSPSQPQNSYGNTSNLTECYPCGILFRREVTYHEHVKVHEGESFKCEDCGEYFESVMTYNSHMDRNH